MEKNPRLFQFCAYLAHFEPRSDTPVFACEISSYQNVYCCIDFPFFSLYDLSVRQIQLINQGQSLHNSIPTCPASSDVITLKTIACHYSFMQPCFYNRNYNHEQPYHIGHKLHQMERENKCGIHLIHDCGYCIYFLARFVAPNFYPPD